jgi:hypothetical protein
MYVGWRHPCASGAKYITVSFEDRTSIIKASGSHITFYKDETLQECWGQPMSGDAMSSWHGARGASPFVVPGDKFVLHFHSGPRQATAKRALVSAITTNLWPRGVY